MTRRPGWSAHSVASMKETDEITTALQTAQPSFVRDFRVAVGDDHNGDPSIWVWAILDDDEFDSPALLEHSQQTNDWIRDAVERVGSDRYPYVRLRSVTDEAA